MIQKSAEYTKPLYMGYIDYEKAFDSVLAAAVLDAVKDQEIEETYIRLLEDIHKECRGRITTHKQSDKIPIRKGVRQGDTISPQLFTACLAGVVRELDCENIG